MTTLVNFDGFYDAARARQIALGQASATNDILLEINAIQVSINSAAGSGTLVTTVSGNTTMTNSSDFFNSWNDPFNFDEPQDKLRREAMQQVINYFTRLGYTIKRKRVGTSSLFEWSVVW